MQKYEIQNTISSLKPELKKRFSVKQLSLFGSYAREEAHQNSDIDILVDFEITPDLLTFIELEDFLSQKLGKPVDLVSMRKLKPILKKQILHEAIAL